MKRSGPPTRTKPLQRTKPLGKSSPLKSSRTREGRSSFAASDAQRAKVAAHPFCVGCGREASEWLAIDPAHLCARARGGCDDPLCVVPLCRDGAGVGCHRSFDLGELDLLSKIVGRWVPEIQHALGHYDGNLLGLLHRLTGERFAPEREAAA